jgi:hypothetical protein
VEVAATRLCFSVLTFTCFSLSPLCNKFGLHD